MCTLRMSAWTSSILLVSGWSKTQNAWLTSLFGGAEKRGGRKESAGEQAEGGRSCSSGAPGGAAARGGEAAGTLCIYNPRLYDFAYT